MATIVLDAGHGGSDFGATYLGRMDLESGSLLWLPCFISHLLEVCEIQKQDKM